MVVEISDIFSENFPQASVLLEQKVLKLSGLTD